MSGAIEIPDAWRELSARIEAEGGLTLLLGASDSGKTTLALWLARTLTAAGRRVALLDGDIGQSTIGPPATVGLAFLTSPSADPNLPPTVLRFIGAVSPADQMLPLATAVKRLAERALAMGAETVLIDTTGLVLGPVGRRLKYYKIDLLSPRYLIALQQANELEPILRLFEGRKGIAIHRLPVSPHLIPRSFQFRRTYRAQRFSEYFQVSSSLELSLREVAIQGTWIGGGRALDRSELRGLERELKTPVLAGERGQDEALLLVQGEPSPDGMSLVRSRLGVSALKVLEVESLHGLLLGLADEENELLALGLLQHLDPGSGRLVCLTPCNESTKVKVIHFGSLRLEPSGAELGEAPVARTLTL